LAQAFQLTWVALKGFTPAASNKSPVVSGWTTDVRHTPYMLGRRQEFDTLKPGVGQFCQLGNSPMPSAFGRGGQSQGLSAGSKLRLTSTPALVVGAQRAASLV